MKYRCLIVDDEELARSLLANFIGRLPHLEVAAQCKDPMEAMAALQQHKVDIVFLDIQMPGLTGVEFLRNLKLSQPVIFTTAYPEYALEGYALDVVDYLLKPFSFERFLQAVNKAIARLGNNQQNHPDNPTHQPSVEKEFILVKADYKLHRIRLDDILYIEGRREYVAYHTPSGRLLALQSLKSLEEELPADRFIRIHKSYIVPIDKIEALEGNMVHIGKVKLPVGASYKEALMERVFKGH